MANDIGRDIRSLTPLIDKGISRWTGVMIGNTGIISLLLVLGFLYGSSSLGLSDANILRPMCLILLLCCAWTLWSWRLVSGSVFNLYGLFLFSASIFNGGQLFLYLFNIDTTYLSSSIAVSVPATFASETILKSAYLIAVGLIGFHFGGLLSFLMIGPGASRNLLFNDYTGSTEERSYEILTAQSLRTVGWGLILLSAVPTALSVKHSLSVVLTVGYLGIFQEGVGSTVSILAAAIVPGAIFLLAGSRRLTFNIALTAALVLAYSMVQFFIGNRGGSAMFLLAYAWTFDRCIRPLPKTLLALLGLTIMFVVFPVVRLFRDSGDASGVSPQSLLETYTSIDNPIVSVLHEMGFSLITVAHTLELVPGMRNFDFGASYLYATFSVIPSIFWESHPTAVHGTLNRWLADTVEPVLSSQYPNWSLGYSFIAEAFLNFGWLGAPVALGVFGFLLGWFVLSAEHSRDIARIAMVGAFMGFFLIFARAEANDVIRSLFWYSLFPYWAVLAIRYWVLRSRKPDRAGW